MFILVKKEGSFSTETFFFTRFEAFKAFDQTTKSRDGFVAVFPAEEGTIEMTKENSLAWK
jgi:hypothetical protein